MSAAAQRAGGERGRLALGEAADACLPAQGLGATRSRLCPDTRRRQGDPVFLRKRLCGSHATRSGETSVSQLDVVDLRAR